jgi:DNA-directed RNA polymerase subunit RPC12/RpoP
MYFRCLDCESLILDPELNTWQCPVCGSENFVVAENPESCKSQFNTAGLFPDSPRSREINSPDLPSAYSASPGARVG